MSSESMQYQCKKCNAELVFPAGAAVLTCQYCGHTEQIVSQVDVKELDYHEYLVQAMSESVKLEVSTIHCDGCGADITIDAKSHSDTCPYCGKNYVANQEMTGQVIAPSAVLPFKITQQGAHDAFAHWSKKRWFAPNDFVRSTKNVDTLRGIYLPFWTFDSSSDSDYTGQRGVHYYVTEHYTAMENGKSVSKTRQVQKTRWYFAFGSVHVEFDDVLVCGSNTLPEKLVRNLEPWDLKAIQPFDSGYLQGYSAERYTISLESAFTTAQGIMETKIREVVKRDIGGDTQQITTLHTEHRNISFKHILLPVWVSAYRYGDKVYRIMINASTGEVQGERPWSWIKITLLVLTLIAIATILYMNGSAVN